VIRAVVFDFDGLILDTEMPVYTAWREMFAAYQCGPLTIEEWGAEIGTIGGLDLVGMMHERAAAPFDEDEMHRRRRSRIAELVASEHVCPGVHAWLDEADALGLPVAIASSSVPEWVTEHLERLGLRPRFVHVACGDGRLAPKPAPDTYVAACCALEVDPADALAVEDSPTGIRAAQRAGLRCVAVPNAITAQLDVSHADLVLSSLADASLSDVLAQLR
jgi:HAD superfamily hydrolase (TIGR01509 family)